MIDPAILENCLQAACSGHGKTYNDGILKMWLGCTSSVTTDQFEEVFWSCCTNGMPKPADLLQKIAGINPQGEWEVIMGVAQGRYESGQISGYAAASLRQIGGVRAVAMAKTEGRDGYTELDWLKKEFAEGLQTSGSGLPAAPEIISLSGTTTTAQQQVSGGSYVDSTGAVCRNDYCDASGKDRADSLIRLLKAGEIKVTTTKNMIGSRSLSGKALERSGQIPAAQRDRVLAAIAEIENNLEAT